MPYGWRWFAWPAGLGDTAIALAAPWMLLALIRRPEFAASRAFIAWNVLGILDLLVAVGTGVLGTLVSNVAIGATTSPMARLPLVLVPAFLVPGFLILHLVALFQARHHVGSPKGGVYRKT